MILQQLWKAYRPPWWQGPNINTFFEAIGALADSIAQRVLDGRLAAIPWAGPGVGVEEPLTATGQRLECQPDALPYHSKDRGIPLRTTMGLQAQRQALAAFRQLRAHKGTHFGEIEHVRLYFADAVAAGFAFPRITIVFQDNEGTPAAVWYSVAPDGSRTVLRASPSNFNYDDQPAKRCRWWAFIDMTGTGFATPHTYDSGGIYDTSGWIYDAPSAQAQADIVAMFNEWHSASSWLAGVILVWPQVGGASFPSASGTPTQDVTGWWSLPNGAGTWSVLVDALNRPTRPPNFSFIFDNPAP